MYFSMISAHDRNLGIGFKNEIPWYIPEDFKWFKEKTNNNVVIMGMNTYFSLPKKNRPLPNRKNIVLCNDPMNIRIIENEGAIVFSSINSVIEYCSNLIGKECFVIGGESIYKQFIDKVSLLYLTEIDEVFECDTFFPKINYNDWNNIYKSEEMISKVGDLKFTFNIYKKIIT